MTPREPQATARPSLLRRIAVTVVLVLGALALLLAIAVSVLLGTTTGARWALSYLAGVLPGSLTTRSLRGTLSSPLELRGVEYRTDSLLITVAHLSARWDVTSLIGRRFDLRRLAADTVRVRVLAAAPRDSTRPRTLPSISLPLDLRVGELRVTDFHYRGVDPGDTLRVDALRLAGAWAGGRASINRLEARSRMADLDARGFVDPRGAYAHDLTLGWTVRPRARPPFRGQGRLWGSLVELRLDQRLEVPFTAHVEGRADSALTHPRVDVRTEFSGLDPRVFVSEPVAMTLAGRLDLRGTVERFLAAGQVSVRSDSLGDLDLDGRVAREGDSLRMDSLVVRTPRRPMRVVARGNIADLSTRPRANVLATWRDLVWPLRGDTTIRSAEGWAAVSGTRAAYRFDLDAALATARLDLGRCQARGVGDTAQARIDSIAARAYGAHMAGAGRIAWAPFLRWQADVAVDGVDPSRWATEFPGRLALRGRSRGEMRGKTLALDATLEDAHGTLRGRPLTGKGVFHMEGKRWAVEDLAAALGRNRLTARGEGGDRWTFDATLEAPELEAVHDSLRGALRVHASLTGEGDQARLAVDCTGDSVVFARDQVRHLEARVHASLEPNAPFDLAVDAQDAAHGDLALRTIHLSGEGTSARHEIGGFATREGDSLAIRLSGGLHERTWQGMLEGLDLVSPYAGAWRIQDPVRVTVSQERASLGALDLASGDAHLRAQGEWSAQGPWAAQGTLAHVPLSLLAAAVLWDVRVEGVIDGRFTGGMPSASGPLEADASLALGPSRLIHQFSKGLLDTIAVRGASLDAGIDHAGARAHLTIQPGASDSLAASVDLPGFDPLHPDTAHQAVRGRLLGRLTGTKLLQMMAPGLTGARGTFTSDLTLTGMLNHPGLSGEARLVDAQASLPQLGLTFREVEARIHGDGSARLGVTGSARSGSGKLELEGTLEPLAANPPKLDLRLRGKDVTVADTRDAQMRASLDLSLGLRGRDATLEGQVEVPEGRIMVAKTMAKLPTPPSPDVVYTDADTVAAADVRLRSRVRLVLGDLVEVRAPGFRCKPKGNLLVVDEPGQPTRGTGDLTLHEGTYTAYGQDLSIEKGRLIFGGGPVTNPTLDIKAVRKVSSDVKAGFNITGTAEDPVLTVFSEPPMSQADALSYVMFGKKFDSSSKETSMAKETASHLAVQGSDVLARELAGKIGLSDASVESKGGLQESSLFLGAYVSPGLYVSYGVGLFQPQRTFRVRYSLSKHWMLQAENSDVQTGTVQYTGEK